MIQFIAINPKVKVNGETVLSVIEGLGVMKNMAIKILSENNINDPKAGQWYLQQDWLNSFKVIAEKIGPNTLYKIGTFIPKKANFPEDIDTIEKALASLDIAYHMNHQLNDKPMFDNNTGELTEGIGHYSFHSINPKKAEIVCDNPYPCDFDRGIIDALAQKFKPKNSVMTLVKHDDTKGCRKNGDKSCTYIVTW